MKKPIIIGVATLAIAGTALIGSSIYAASGISTNNSSTTNSSRHEFHGQNEPQNLINSLSGKVSTEALTALQDLLDKQKTEMDALRNAATKPTATEMRTQMNTFKTAMDTLMTQYPELKTAIPTPPNGGKMRMERGGHRNGQMEAIMATLPTQTQTDIKAIRDDYRAKQEALRTEEKIKTDAILANYPDAKGKLDALEASRPQMNRNEQAPDQGNSTSSSTTAN